MSENQIELISEKKVGNEIEEISERKTSTLGYLMLCIMAVFLIIVGQTIFSDLNGVIKKPKYPSACVTSLNFTSYNAGYGENYFAYSSSRSLKELSYFPMTCDFGEIDKKFNLDSNFNSIESQVRQIASLNEQLRSLQSGININEKQIDNLNSRYDVGLQEKMAGETAPVMDNDGLRSGITEQQSIIKTQQSGINDLTAKRDQLILKVTPTITRIQSDLELAFDFYNKSVSWYNFKVFLLKLLFISPIFALALYYYLRLKKKNSPYTIIFTAVVGASSLLFLEIILVLLYDIIPRGLLAKIFKIFMSTPILRYVLYYGSVFLVLGIFGGIVYYIQKRVYSLKNVAMRRLRDNKCPNCSFVINMYYNNCPKCGRQLKEKCVSCGNLRISDLPHCPNCGK